LLRSVWGIDIQNGELTEQKTGSAVKSLNRLGRDNATVVTITTNKGNNTKP
jgi:hypothetical protein